MYDPKILAANIRQQRKSCGLTQSDLSEMLFVTAQNISKWELGQSTPDVSNLCRLAEVFGTSVDALLGTGGALGGEVMVAIDGGGTKTEFLLLRRDGEVLCRYVGRGSNPNAYGVEAAAGELCAGLLQLGVQKSGATVISAGIAGCGSREHARNMAAEIKKVCPTAEVRVTSDIENVILAEECEDNAIAVITGTGSSVFAKCGGELRRFGGWGYLYDRSFSGYDLGREAIRATLAQEEGIEKRTALAENVEGALGFRPSESLSRLYAMTPSDVASVSEAVFSAYDGGDAAAKRIIGEAIDALAKNIISAMHHCKSAKKIIISGGLAARRDVICEHLARHGITDGNGVSISFPTAPQVYGAAIGAIGGIRNLTSEFSQRFFASYKSFLE